MTVKDILDKISNGVVLISKDNQIVADNVDCLGDIEKYYNNEVVTMSPFYSRQGLYKYGLIINV